MALIIVDIQEFYFEGGFLPLEGSVEAAQSAQLVLERFRANGWPVVHVQHLPEGRDAPGQDVQPPVFRIRKEVEPRTGEIVVGKHHPNSFRDTNLQDELQKFGTNQLVIVGMQTHMCLEAATRAAADLGYQVTVVKDACATRDLEYGGATVPAAQVHASTLASLNGAYATVVSSDEFLKNAK
jgi:nicotinamidase-related amidase